MSQLVKEWVYFVVYAFRKVSAMGMPTDGEWPANEMIYWHEREHNREQAMVLR
jgi:hypothetical protein